MHEAERDSGEFSSVKRREPKDLLQAIQLKRRGDVNLGGGHDVVDEGQWLGSILRHLGCNKNRRCKGHVITKKQMARRDYLFVVGLVLFSIALILQLHAVFTADEQTAYLQQVAFLLMWMPALFYGIERYMNALTERAETIPDGPVDVTSA